jgi:hypothetical protein
MSSLVSLDPEGFSRFSLPHALRLVGEHQHLLRAGAILVASNLRVGVEVEETSGGFSLAFLAPAAAEEGALGGGQGHGCRDEAVAELAGRWQGALAALVAEDESLLEGLSIRVHLGELAEVCSLRALGLSPAVAVALAVAVTAQRAQNRALSDVDLARAACRLRSAVVGQRADSSDRFFGEALMSIAGGAGYVEAAGERLNVQQLLPPDSLLLALAPSVHAVRGAEESEQAASRALARVRQRLGDVGNGDDETLGALFALPKATLSERETAMLYGLLRVRQMTESFLEYLGESLVDNDRLAETCDEESAILEDYLGFPGQAFASARAAAVQAGALGTKLTWAFGSFPAAVVIAPGRREEVLASLRRKFADVAFLPIDVDPTGLLRGGDPETDSAEDG